MLQHPLAFSRGIYPSAWGSGMSGRDCRQGINPRAESQSSLKAAILQWDLQPRPQRLSSAPSGRISVVLPGNPGLTPRAVFCRRFAAFRSRAGAWEPEHEKWKQVASASFSFQPGDLSLGVGQRDVSQPDGVLQPRPQRFMITGSPPGDKSPG